MRTRHHHVGNRGRPGSPRPARDGVSAVNPGNASASQHAAFTATAIKAATQAQTLTSQHNRASTIMDTAHPEGRN